MSASSTIPAAGSLAAGRPAAFAGVVLGSGWDAAALLLEMLREGWPSAFAGVGGRYGLLGRSDPPVITYRLTRAGWRLG